MIKGIIFDLDMCIFDTRTLGEHILDSVLAPLHGSSMPIGIQNEIDPGSHTDVNLYSLSESELARIPHAPGSLPEALDCLEKDHTFLTESSVFSESFLNAFIEQKRSESADEAMRPTPNEFFRYFDV